MRICPNIKLLSQSRDRGFLPCSRREIVGSPPSTRRVTHPQPLRAPPCHGGSLRFLSASLLSFIYAVWVYFVQGFYVVSYALDIYLLNLVVAFLSPQEDPELSNGPTIPFRSL
ncbi:hypothetical protein ACS0TY_023341 [Phlomoides rotata]